MSETDVSIDALLDELRGLTSTTPVDAKELATLLARAKSAAGHWADVLYELHESAQRFAGPRAAAAMEIAFRRAEESYTELEIAYGDLASGPGG
ncbi:hypothetical protein AQ490_05145 [Wenjunlia vitaminophila]|uniref:Uncharacterized protein n=1 Tax=Wenjunlia vitaminophila TaxID=76728 RepID=A0A0T6LNT9_WENVI|nr:hypothetical protein [Wenjunlia vitaminophila]KRV47763.1 hypothetical protein AQ490_05145 [Wenjunlia vitaminophila]